MAITVITSQHQEKNNAHLMTDENQEKQCTLDDRWNQVQHATHFYVPSSTLVQPPVAHKGAIVVGWQQY
jgi:hypothetical protein